MPPPFVPLASSVLSGYESCCGSQGLSIPTRGVASPSCFVAGSLSGDLPPKPAFFDRPPVPHLGGDRWLSYLAEAQVPSSPTREGRDKQASFHPADSTQSAVIFIFTSANLRLYVPSDTASRPSWPRDPSINHPAPLARHLGPVGSHLEHTSSAAPPAVVPSVPFHRSPFSLLLSGNRT